MATEEGNPYVERPDVIDDVVDNGLICFFNMDRPCSADCMAWTTQPSESTVLNQQQKHCIALVSVERLGRFSGVLVQLAKKGAGNAG